MRALKEETLSLFPYYGGKAQLAHTICDLLDYSTTSIYVEPFGGGARTLLNKRPHPMQIYNDGSACLCAFMRVMSRRDTAFELVDRLHKTEYSKEQFEAAKQVCSCVDDSYMFNALQQEYKELKHRLSQMAGVASFNDKRVGSVRSVIERVRQSGAIWAEETIQQFAHHYLALSGDEEIQMTPPPYDDIDIAEATFILYTMSRDGMGTYFSPAKFKTQEAYHKRIDRLLQAIERLEGLQVLNVDTRLLFEKHVELFVDSAVMAYCDPPYLSDQELKGPKDLGVSYHYRMGPEAHEAFLRQAVKCGCKMLISNYDCQLYNDYLHDWTRIDIPVKTSVGGKANNQRVEVLWYNY